MIIELLVILIIIISIIYLTILLRKKKKYKPKIKKKVTFFGVPTQIDSIKPVFKPRHFKKKKHTFRFNPFNNIETYENCAIEE